MGIIKVMLDYELHIRKILILFASVCTWCIWRETIPALGTNISYFMTKVLKPYAGSVLTRTGWTPTCTGRQYNWFNIRTRSPLNLIPNSKRERTVVVTILAEECTLNLDLIPKINW